MHMVSSGHVVITISTPLGQQLAFSILGPGDSFGELSVVMDDVRSATARALDVTETLALQRTDLNRLRRDHPEVNEALLRVLAVQVRRLSSRLAEHLYLSVDARIGRRLLELSVVYGSDKGPTVIPLSHEVLADLAGATRPTVTTALNRMHGVVALGRRQMTVLDREALRRIARVGHQ
jgi:CRP-like cAMP-binding protein